MVLVLVTGLMLLSPVVQAQEQSGMMDDDMQGMMMGGMGMMGGSGMGGGMGMMGGDGMCGGMGMMQGGMGPLRMLNLTAEQRTKINAIHDSLRKEHWAIMGKMMDEQAKLRDLFEAEKPDTKKIGPVFDTIFSLRKQMILSRIDAINSVREVLTKEQLDQLKQWHRSRWQGACGGTTPGAGPGHMHGGMMGK
jgi:Spy/CpxP family protein refolding chaperone